LAIAIVGAAMIAFADADDGRDSLWGDLLAMMGASILAYLLLGEKVSEWTFLGGVMTLIGVGIVLLSESRRNSLQSAEAN
jgi:hypothetical protein